MPADIRSALLATSPVGQRDEHLIARLDDLVNLDVGLVELFPEPAKEPSESLTALVHARETGDGPRWDVHRIWGDVRTSGVGAPPIMPSAGRTRAISRRSL